MIIERNLHRSRLRHLATGASIIAVAFALPAHAQAVAPGEGLVVEEIIVTAEKREQSLQRVPMAISALSASMLRDAGTVDMQGVANLVPSLTAAQVDRPMNQTYRVRGIGSDPNIPTFEPDVALFIDGVYMPRTGLGIDDLVDLARVEVLKGPQSTLYGKNAAAGVVNVVSSAPSRELQGRIEASLSNSEGARNALTYRLAGSISGPLTDNVRVRLTGVYYNQDHTFVNLTPGAGNANEMKRYALRGQIEFDLSDQVTLNLTGAHTKILKSDAINPDLYLGAFPEAAVVADGLLGPFTALRPLFPNSVGCANNNPTDRIICTGSPKQSTGDSDMASATLTAKLDFATLTSITAWSRYGVGGADSNVAQLSLPLISFNDIQKGSAYSQELRLVSPTGTPFEWLVGGYYLNTKFARGDNGQTPIFQLQGAAPYFPMPLPPATVTALAPFFAGLTQLNTMGVTNIPAPGTGRIVLGQNGDQGFLDSRASSEYWAAFAQGTLHLSEQFALTGGLRWQTEDKNASLNNRSVTAANPYFVNVLTQLAALPTPVRTALGASYNVLVATATQLAGTNILSARLVPTSVNGSLPTLSKSSLNWTATANFTPNRDTLLYATYARGNKSGGYNIGFGNAPVSSLAFKPERVDNMEIGVKLSLLDRRARLAISAFSTTYHDYQNAGFVGLQFLVNNAEKARVRGIEFDGAFALAKGLSLNAGASFLDAKFVKYTGGACSFGTVPNPVTAACDLSGRKLPLTPSTRITGGLHYDHTIGLGTFYGRADVNWQSKATTNSANLDPRSIQNAYAMANLRLGLRTESGFDISLWSNNVFNKTVVQFSAVLNLLSSNPDGTTTSGYQNYLSAPRQFGLTLRKTF